MAMSNNTKGILFALGAALSISNVYIFSKAALNQVHLAQFGVFWFGLGLVWNAFYMAGFGKYRLAGELKARNWWGLLLISLLEMISTLFFFVAISTVEQPAVVSFLANINPLFVVAMGMIVLKEKINITESLGMTAVLSGALLISMTGVSGEGVFVHGSEYVLLSGFVSSIATLVAKKQLKYMDASYVSSARLVMLFLLSIIALWWLKLPLALPRQALINIGIGSLLGPFLAGILGYMALKHIEMSKATMVRSVRSLFVLSFAWLYFDSVPAGWQIVGGVLTMSGVVLIALGKLRMKRQKQSS